MLVALDTKSKSVLAIKITALVVFGSLCLGGVQPCFSADAQTQQYQLIKSYVDQNRSINAQIQTLNYMLKPVEQQWQRPQQPVTRTIPGVSYSTRRSGGSDAGAGTTLPRQQLLVPFGFTESAQSLALDALTVADDILGNTDRRKPEKVAPVASARFADIWDAYQHAGNEEGAAAAIAKAQPLAAGGNSDAMLLLAMAHVLGRGAKQDDTQAFNWTSRAAQSGSVVAKAQLGEFYANGVGVRADSAKALDLMKQAADAGNLRAGWRYAHVLLESRSPAGDYARALRYAEAAEATEPRAALEVGMILAAPHSGVTQNDARAVAAFGRAAKAGDAIAQYLFATCLSAGVGVQKNPVESTGWLEKSAAQGLSPAQSRLGDALLYGDGLPADPVRAIKLLQLAADEGDGAAFNDLGVAYSDGRGVTSDPARAVDFFRQGAELGDRDAQLNLGLAYNLGRGVAQSGPEGLRWLALAAEAGSAPAQYASGMMLLGGSDVPGNVAQGVARLRSAADRFPPALHELCDLSMRERSGIRMDSADFTPTLVAGVATNQPACIYVQASRLIRGTLGPKDPAQAFEMLTRAADLGYHQAELDLGKQYISAAAAVIGDQRLDALSEARHWLARSADHGNAEAYKLMQAQGWR